LDFGALEAGPVTEVLLERHTWSSGCLNRRQKVVLIADPERSPSPLPAVTVTAAPPQVAGNVSSPAPGGAAAAGLANAANPSNAVDETIATLAFIVPP
jgi:hypothetical protein